MSRSVLKQTTLLVCLLGAFTAAQAQAQYRSDDPFKAVLGNWKTTDARFTSSTSEPEFANRITNWAGKMYGVVKPSGQFLFKAENGCILSGIASPFASNGLWALNGLLEGCSVGHFNQKIFGNLRREGNEILLEVSDLPFAVGRPPVGYFVKTRMVAY